MGWFKRKTKEPDFDLADCEKKKARFREIFNDVVSDGDTYTLLRATCSESKFEKGVYINKTTTTFYFYIVGYRRSDHQVILVQISDDLTKYNEAFYIDMDAITDVYYDAKVQQACLVYRKNYGSYGEILTLQDSHRKARHLPNISQKEEREDFLNFLEEFRHILEQKGCKLSKWKR